MKSSFARQVGILISGTALAQLIPIAISPILTRLYDPEDFGLIALYTACVAVVTVVATGRYEMAIMLPKSDTDSLGIAKFTLRLCLVTSLLLYIPIIFFSDQISSLLANPDLAPWLYLLPISVIATCIFNIFLFWHNRQLQFRRMSENRIQHSALTGLFSISLGLANIKGGLLIGGVLGQSAVAILACRRAFFRPVAESTKLSIGEELALAKRYISHPKHIAPAQLIGVVAQQFPLIIVSSAFSLTTAGFFSIAYKIVSIPSILIANSIGDVYRQRISKAYNENGEFGEILLSTLKKTIALALPPFITIYLLSPWLFKTVFGPDWHIAGEFAQILAVSSFFQFVFTPIDKGALVVGASRYIFFWNAFRLFAYLGLFVLTSVKELSILETLWSFVTINALMYVSDGIVEYYLATKKAK